MLGAIAARRLRAAGAEVVLFEAAPSLGGLASAWSLPVGDDTVVWDRFYHVILGNDRRVLDLVADLGVGDVRWAASKAACFTGGKLLPATSGAELLGLPFLGLLAKLRIALTVAWAALWPRGKRFDDITSARWLRRWSGRQATDRLWMPLLRAKLGESADRASAVFIWSTIRRLALARFQGRNGDRFGHVPGGYASILAALAEQLRSEGVEVRTDAGVTRVIRHDGGFDVAARKGSETFDRVLMTTSAPVTSRLCPQLAADEHERLGGVEYLGVVCPSVVLRRSAGDAYITYITDPLPFTAVIEMTALVPTSELGGHHLVYLPRYVSPDDPVFEMSDEQVRADYLPAFLAMYGLEPADILTFQVARARHVMPVPTPGYAKRAPAVCTSLPGLYAVGSARITVGTLNVESTLSLVDEAWAEIVAPVASSREPIAREVAS
jgi:protoporphyrinogen oxidase